MGGQTVAREPWSRYARLDDCFAATGRWDSIRGCVAVIASLVDQYASARPTGRPSDQTIRAAFAPVPRGGSRKTCASASVSVQPASTERDAPVIARCAVISNSARMRSACKRDVPEIESIAEAPPRIDCRIRGFLRMLGTPTACWWRDRELVLSLFLRAQVTDCCSSFSFGSAATTHTQVLTAD